ncbi:MAG: NUDIX domain-containing protein [Clostridia bacterium]|nr:NUDIX domain-containing protein [Clostridia bacterium]
MDSRECYENGLLFHHYANTAYPLTPASFMKYKLRDEDEILSFVKSEWAEAEELSLYIHIPFCKTRCKFCEYVVVEGAGENAEDEYTDLLLKEMDMYAKILKDKRIVGYDLGGGTPAKLSCQNLLKITNAVNEKFNISPGTVFSIETTPLIAANEPEKIKAIYDMGYKRISMGVQTVSEKLLSELGRDGSMSIYEKAVKNIRSAGFERFNIDLMYGFLHQSEADFDNTLKYAVGLNPEYITLYRNRYKGTKIESEAGGVSIYKAMYQYRIAHRTLTENGYSANVGKNTFSRVEGDYGTSDYLTKRVINGTPYVGMGLGAQSFGMNYLSYNLGAADKRMEKYKTAVLEGRLPFQDIYRLPLDESIAKMVSVAFYFAFVDLTAFKKRFGVDFFKYFAKETEFVLENGLMEQKGSRLYLTERGSDFINGIIPLFYSERSKEELKTAFLRKSRSEEADEKLFLSAYNINDYDRPSVASDICVFSLQTGESECYRKNPKQHLSLLLIRRGEHPFMNRWALPGGFVRANETIEQCAHREVTEETGVSPYFMLPVGIFSTPGRDPRGRIISYAYASVLSEENVRPLGGDDAIDAKWFEVDFQTEESGNIRLTLTNENILLTALLSKKRTSGKKYDFEIIENSGFAFDHAVIIQSALSTIREEAALTNLAFEFLPEKFTLSSLQRVQETLTGVQLLPANFRRKIQSFVEETDEYVEGAGHRPAQLFRRK